MVKKINYMAIPLILNGISSIIISLCDQAIVGRMSLVAFGAVGLISTTVNSIAGVLGSISIAFNIIGAKHKGKNEHEKLRINFIVNILISVIVGILFFFGTLKLGPFILEKVYHLRGISKIKALEYLNIFSLSLGLNMILFTFSSYFKITNRTKNILYGNLIASISNILFDYILIFGHFGFPEMGVKGSAIGTILALILNIIVYFFIIKKDKIFSFSNFNLIRVIKPILSSALPIMGQDILESALLVIVINSTLSRIGILEVAVYNLLLTLVSIASMAVYSYSQTSLTIISESNGSKSFENIKFTPKICLLFSGAFYILFMIILLRFKKYVPSIITNDTKLIQSATDYMSLALITNIPFIPSTIYKYSLQGMEDGRWVFIVSIAINLFNIGIVFLLVEVLGLGLHGIYAGMILNYIISSMLFHWRYKKLIAYKKELNFDIMNMI